MVDKKKSGSFMKPLSTKKAEAPKPVEAPGKKVEAKAAIVEEATYKVRGAAVGGVKMMTKTQYDAYCAKK